MKIVGIDPMDQGALAFMDLADPVGSLAVIDMPVVHITKSRRELDISGLWSLITDHRPQRAYVEKMQPMPLGSMANFKRGAYLYTMRCIAHGLGISLMEVAPKEWQKAFKIKATKDQDTKTQAYLIASRIFPHLDLKTARDRILDGRCDAVLIAEYGRQQELGKD